MAILLRPAQTTESALLSRLCLRSKGYWGYDAAFLESCREELTIDPQDCADPGLIVAVDDSRLAGVARVGPEGDDAGLLLLFVDPDCMGKGVGRMLFNWCLETAGNMGAHHLRIEADPGAEAFYRHMGAVRAGECASASIPGRILPLLEFTLR